MIRRDVPGVGLTILRGNALVLVFGLSLAGMPPPATRQLATDAAMTVAPGARPVLDAARAYLGGSEALRSVRSLDVTGKRTRFPPEGVEGVASQTDPFAFRIMLPDCFRRVTRTVVHTLAGGRFWQKPSFDPEMTATAKRNITYDFAYTSTVYLLQPALLQVDVTDAGVQQAGSIRGRVLRYSGPGFDVRLVLDERSFQPLAVVRTSVLQRGDESSEHLNVLVLLDYRPVDGIRIPFRTEQTIGTFTSVTILESVKLNTLTRADFAEQ